ncbi:hypothetical protein GUF72_06460 [Xanthomonas citri pv. citri]|uniref:Uncharacterized protein n=3 Tax=Xanthomonas citri TaxID=346 RepID=A0A8I0LD08_XANCI|nr:MULTISPECIES: hypothetical protein [Xanthomonas]AJY82369.1 hypothetical protein J159_02408 [Xanthomonas citri pv. citri]AJY86793.1 hypothetical protein J158_02410 [Xanthomonas citri subsp. citri UI6]AJY91224.1 hypothetical protein J169_02417 [Xanthomonas citri pv. citri]AJY95684.1 hypothetical protein J164_02406 [Xanthomonas citri pv. citri]AJZ00107.1 hypothetical protein J163_02404 [Xanthomonas citri pv. citri]
MISLPPGGRPRMRWPLVAGTVAVLALGITTAFNTARLSRMEQETQSANLDAEMQTLGDSLAQLRGAFEAAQHRPPFVSEAAFSAAQQAIGERITRLEQAQAGAAKTEELTALAARTDALQSQMAARPSAVRKPRASDASVPEPLPPSPPPFALLGTELRGGVPFLAIVPTNGASPAEVRLLREGDQERGWRLEAIERDTAQFTVGEQVRRLPLRSR